MSLAIVILAAGQGVRMVSALPKTLHPLGGKPILRHIVETAQTVSTGPPYIVYGYGGQQLQEALQGVAVQWVEQAEQLGTGHALAQVLPVLQKIERVLVLSGDVPLISSQTLQSLLNNTPADSVGIVTASVTDPAGLGRIIRDPKTQRIVEIVEERDASVAQRQIQEINAGIYLLPFKYLSTWMSGLNKNNHQNEYYLTDIISYAASRHLTIVDVQPENVMEIQGVNTREQLAILERYYQSVQAKKLMKQGVTLRDPARFDVRGDVMIGKEVDIDVNVILEGKVTIGNHCRIGANTVLRDTILADHVVIKENCVIDNAVIEKNCAVGPFARIRSGVSLNQNTYIGNFAEIKNSHIGKNNKICHFSYIGDTKMENNINIGAGTVTCNYDGANKYKTIIRNNAFIGSGTELIAPLTVEENAFVAAGSTLNEDAPANQLTIARAKQNSIPHWKRPVKKEDR